MEGALNAKLTFRPQHFQGRTIHSIHLSDVKTLPTSLEELSEIYYKIKGDVLNLTLEENHWVGGVDLTLSENGLEASCLIFKELEETQEGTLRAPWCVTYEETDDWKWGGNFWWTCLNHICFQDVGGCQNNPNTTGGSSEEELTIRLNTFPCSKIINCGEGGELEKPKNLKKYTFSFTGEIFVGEFESAGTPVGYFSNPNYSVLFRESNGPNVTGCLDQDQMESSTKGILGIANDWGEQIKLEPYFYLVKSGESGIGANEWHFVTVTYASCGFFE